MSQDRRPAIDWLQVVSMTSNSPHFLLFSEASSVENNDRCSLPTWRFVLQNVESQRRFSAADSEPCDCSQRLELLAVVRGLEALDGPSRVTLVTKSRYVSRGIKKGLAEWRANNWKWEHFGSLRPVRDYDLWKRVDRALQFHQVSCQAWHFETIEVEAAESLPAPEFSQQREEIPVITRRTRRRHDGAHWTPPPKGISGPRVIQRIKRRAQAQAAQLTNALEAITGPMADASGAAT